MALLPRLRARAETRLAATLALAGRMREAARHLERAAALVPGWDPLAAARTTYEFEHETDLQHLVAGVRAAMAGRPAG